MIHSQLDQAPVWAACRPPARPGQRPTAQQTAKGPRGFAGALHRTERGETRTPPRNSPMGVPVGPAQHGNGHLPPLTQMSLQERLVWHLLRQSLLIQSPCPLSDPGNGPLRGSCLRLGPARAPAGPPGYAGQPHECPQPVPAHLPDGHPEWHCPQLPVTPREQVSDPVSIQFHTGGGIRCPFQGAWCGRAWLQGASPGKKGLSQVMMAHGNH